MLVELLVEVQHLRAEVTRLEAELAEHRAARGLSAPAGWAHAPLEGHLWQRPCGAVDADGECAAGWLYVEEARSGFDWGWWAPGKGIRVRGHEDSALGAIAAAASALAAGGGS